MRRTVLLAAVLSSAALTGCIGDTGDGLLDAANSTDTPTDAADVPANASVPTFPNGTLAPEKLAYSDCTEQMGSLPVPAQAFEDQLPEGFSLAPYGTLLASPNEPTGQTAELVVAGSECQRADGATSSRAFAFVFVDPPDAWENPDAGWGHALLVTWITTSEQATSVYDAWGLEPATATGEVTLQLTQTPIARAGTLAANADDRSLTLRTAVEGQPVEPAADEGRLFAAGPDGDVTGAMDVNFTAPQVGLGTAEASGELGLDPVSAQTGLGLHSWAFDEAFTYVDLTPREAS